MVDNIGGRGDGADIGRREENRGRARIPEIPRERERGRGAVVHKREERV